jgi:hypothetical protein
MPATAVPAIAAPAAAPAAPAPAAAQPAAQASALCVSIEGLPVYDGATCAKHDTDEDDGVIKHENTYTSPIAGDEIRRFYEQVFASGGWAVTEFNHDAEDVSWSYTVAKGLREVKVEVEQDLAPGGVLTKIELAEK